MDWQNISLLNSIQDLLRQNPSISILSIAHQCYVQGMQYHLAEQAVLVGVVSAFITKYPICSFSERDSVETLTFLLVFLRDILNE